MADSLFFPPIALKMNYADGFRTLRANGQVSFPSLQIDRAHDCFHKREEKILYDCIVHPNSPT